MCEKARTRKYRHIKPVSVKSLKKHMHGAEELVQDRINSQLQGQKVGFGIDAWTGDGTHFIVVIAWTPKDKFLFCFSTLEDESDMRSDSIIDLLDDVLDTYAIDIS
ncbi:hypothetical protein JG688_00005775 [Phytophthora aleatoria]|uniref:Uncharacterized protein n=1 Tax=Phytophthora aleatoria TaxID=2496075 RepID=A0A8J5J1Q8_9STRA|nr:hypothetical protein JG688_00005775 [Phytophthora aleatoria]